MAKKFIVESDNASEIKQRVLCEITPEELELLKCRLEGKATRFSDEIIRSENLLKKLEEIL